MSSQGYFTDIITVEVVNIGDPISRVALNKDGTVEEALVASKFGYDGKMISVNGSVATLGDRLHDGDKITIGKLINSGS